MNTPDPSIMQVFDAYKAAVFAKDADAFVALYDPEVCVFDLWGQWSYDSAQAWRAAVGEWFGSLGAQRVVVDFDEVRTVLGQDLAVAHAFVGYKGVSAEGRDLHAMSNRITWSLKRSADGWKIIHEHTSAPVDFGTAKVMLQR